MLHNCQHSRALTEVSFSLASKTLETAAFIFDFEYRSDSLVEGMLYLDGGVGQILILDTQMGKTYCRMPWCIPNDKEDLAS